MNIPQTSIKPRLGTWQNLPTTDVERAPKVEFEVNIPVTLRFLVDDPREYEGESGAYYVFDVSHEGNKKAIITSAWTLLGALKKHMPLKDKTLTITKKIVKSKQLFVVE